MQCNIIKFITINFQYMYKEKEDSSFNEGLSKNWNLSFNVRILNIISLNLMTIYLKYETFIINNLKLLNRHIST